MRTRTQVESPPHGLARLRAEIDALDSGLIDLIAHRMRLAREAVALRVAAGLPGEDLAREAAVVRRASTLARARGVEPETTREVFWRLVGLSRLQPLPPLESMDGTPPSAQRRESAQYAPGTASPAPRREPAQYDAPGTASPAPCREPVPPTDGTGPLAHVQSPVPSPEPVGAGEEVVG